jgi:23S rRNA pseudouridine1911/1915/1917 synthase
MELNILYEDNHLIAVEKPAGLLIQGDSSGDETLIDRVKEYLRLKYRKPGEVFLGMVHRLDRPVSGAVLFARTSKAASRLFTEFSSRNVLKVYCAAVHCPSERAGFGEGWQTLRGYLVREGDRSVVLEEKVQGALDCELEARVIARREGSALVMARLVTGRKHQIRAQLAALGMPVIGDARYGSDRRIKGGSIMLHSMCIRVAHPTRREPVEIVSEPPPSMLSLFSGAGNLMDIVRERWFSPGS